MCLKEASDFLDIKPAVTSSSQNSSAYYDGQLKAGTDVWHLKSVSCRFISCRVTVAACVNKGYNKTVLLMCFDFTILKPCKLTVTVTVTHNTGLLMTLEWSGRSIHPHTLLSLSFFKEVLKSFPDSYLLSLNLLFPAL